jgi:hypothetical protein
VEGGTDVTGEFLALTLSGLIVNLAGIGFTSWLSHRKLRARLDHVTAQQTKAIAGMTDSQTKSLVTVTDEQTRELLRHRWWRRRA